MRIGLGNGFILVAAALLLPACSKPQPPTISPKAVRVATVGPLGIGLTVELDVTNPNAFPLVARSVDGTFAIGPGAGTELGHGHADPASSIPANGTATVSSELAVSWTNLAALAPFALSPAPVPYRFNGTATIGGEKLNVSVPFVLSGELTREQVLNAGLGGLGLPGLR